MFFFSSADILISILTFAHTRALIILVGLKLLNLVLVQLYRGVVRVQPVISALLVIIPAVVLVRHHDVLRWQRLRLWLRTVRRFYQRFKLALLVVQPNELGKICRLVYGRRLAGLDGLAVDQVPIQVRVEKLRRNFALVGQLNRQVVRDDNVVCLSS